MRVAPAAIVIVLLTILPDPAAAQLPLATSTYRVFLKSGEALPSYGAAVQVGDRLIFNLPIVAEDEEVSLQLMSLPAGIVDVDRTSRYAETMRAELYAATRGEADFAALTADVTRHLGLITSVGGDWARQLALAEEQRDRLQAWSRDHFRYRDQEVRELVGLFNDVINELRVATGAAVSLDLSSGPVEPTREPLLAAPGSRESVEMAMAAARAADVGEDRLAILRAAERALSAGEVDLRARVARAIELEARASAAYAALAAEMRRRADAAVSQGDPEGVERLQAELLRRDQQLGFRRAGDVQRLMGELEERLGAARAGRAALDRYAATRRARLIYERQVRPALVGLDGLTSVLGRIRDHGPLGVDQTISAGTRLQSLQDALERVLPPADLAAVHATLLSAVRLAKEACLRRQQANVTAARPVALEASAAAAGAMLLAGRAREDLVAALFPPRLR